MRRSWDVLRISIFISGEVYVSAGAGFVVAAYRAVMTMPGLPKVPAANGIDVSEEGNIVRIVLRGL